MRTPRFNVPGVTYHLIWRFVDRAWFLSDDEERNRYLRLLGRGISLSNWRILAYALMSNHIHLAAVAGASPMASWTRRVNSPFVRWMNERHDRLGSMIADRAADYGVRPADEPALIAYIHNNPVRAGVVDRAAASSWTSHRAYIGSVDAPPWLQVTEGLARCGLDQLKFDEWVRDTPGHSGEAEVERIRRAIKNRGALRLASPSRSSVPLVARRFATVRADPARIVMMVAELMETTTADLTSRRRSPLVVAARHVALHAGIAVGLTGSDVATALGMSAQGASTSLRRELNDDERAVYEMVVERIRFETASGSPSLAAK
jgi:REP element-mobilizing transposase RayT